MLEQVINGWIKERLNNVDISTAITRRGKKWSLMIVADEDGYGTSSRFTNAIDWSIEQLKNWPDCNRMSYDTWYFKYKKDAEKFSTLFTLKWAK